MKFLHSLLVPTALLPMFAVLPAMAAPTTEELLRRIEQLEQRQREADEALAGNGSGEQEPALVSRLKDVEFRTLSLQRQARMIEALDGVTASFGLVMVGQSVNKEATVDDSGESHLNYRADVVVTLPGGDMAVAAAVCSASSGSVRAAG